jgi:putative FmdB family regulatory protein
MPIYEYRCASCGHELEALQKLSDAPLTECPACHQPELKKLISAAGFQLKGSGWYATDFRNSGGKPAPTGVAAGKTGSAKDSTSAAGASTEGAGNSASSTEGKSGESKTAAGSASTSGTTTGTTSGGSGS